MCISSTAYQSSFQSYLAREHRSCYLQSDQILRREGEGESRSPRYPSTCLSNTINSRALVRRMAIQHQPRRILKMELWLASLATSPKHRFKVRQVVRLLRVLAHRVERKQPFGKSIRQDEHLVLCTCFV